MFPALQIVAIFLVAVTMSMALAHALEFPGKLRLDRDTYLAVQTIYYPGFTIGGIGEPLSVIATLILLVVARHNGAEFWWILTAFLAVLVMQGIFWFMTQPTNRYWLKNQPMNKAGAQFFAVDQKKQTDASGDDQDWRRLRDRWEYSHVIRACLAVVALIALVVAAVL